MSELAVLITRRGALKGQITRLANYIRDNKTKFDIEQIRLRVERAAETFDDFQQVQTQIEEETGVNEDNEKYREEFEELYYENVAICNRLLRTVPDHGSSLGENNSTSKPNIVEKNSSIQAVQPAVKLAAIQIPEFSGSYTEWAAFYDIYMALIHNNKTLSDVEKFFYLRSSLRGEAENVILCLQTTSENYSVAWKSLIARYDNKKVLIQVHVKALFELELIKKESSSLLRVLVDTVSGHIKALESLGQTPANWGALLLFLITSKLDSITRREWESVSSTSMTSEITELIGFLETRFRILEAIETAKQATWHESIQRPATSKNRFIKSNAFAATSDIKCFVCKQTHTIYRCPVFLNLSICERIKKTNELKLCKICLRLHAGEKCTSRRCPKCTRPHNGLLHLPRGEVISKPTNQRTSSEAIKEVNNTDNDFGDNSPSVSINAHACRKNNNQILLSTAEIIAYDYQNRPIPCRVLLDSGSQHNFITESMSQRLRLKRIKTLCAVIGINETSHTSTYKVTAVIKSRVSNYSVNLEFFALPKLTNKLPLKFVNIDEFKLPIDIELADPSFNTPTSIDMILGAEIFFELLNNGQVRPIPHGPILQSTRFGWVVAGPVLPTTKQDKIATSVALFTSIPLNKINLENQMAEFWRLEEVRNDGAYTLEEKVCITHFKQNVSRDANGRFTVVLPFRDTLKLGNSYEVALRRFLSLERRLQSDSNLKKDYVKFIREYLELGHMELAHVDNCERKCYYLPHHAVRNDSSITTKLRVVFDASAKTDSGLSLNDVLCKGPCIQEELVTIMARFRTHKYVLTADVKKMYRQFWVTKSQRDYQRILWREDPNQPINIFCLKTVTYGVITSSYLATACLQKLAEEEATRYPEACQSISQDFYMDDFLGGAPSKEEASKLRNDLITVLGTAGMQLDKWSSNSLDLLPSSMPKSTNGLCTKPTSEKKFVKILGVYWSPENDVYQYNVRPYENSVRTTKRTVLSEIATIFDPLGLISPVVIRFKILMQRLWQLSIGWDETLPCKLDEEWRNYRSQLISLNSLKINRSVIGSGNVSEVQLHGFADASTIAYGACIYLRVTNTNGACITNLICSKSRVAPLKTVSLPRLELLATVLLTRLTEKYTSKLRLKITEQYYWSDSTIVLAWISSQSSKWKTFVAHRVGEIHERTSISQWHHVSSKENPADIVSRGCYPSEIQDKQLWWHGPKWLIEDYSVWPKSKKAVKDDDEVLLEQRSTVSYATTARIDYDLSILERYSSLTKLLRVLSYCRRFVQNTSQKYNKIYGELRVSEIEETNINLIKLIQANSFGHDLLSSQNTRRGGIVHLRPFFDHDGLIRVGGRLQNASTLDEFQRHPIILPAKSIFTKLIFVQEHERLMHGGPQAMLAAIRLKFWPLNGRNIARNVVHKCVKCFKYRPVVMQPIMGDLPKARVSPARVFKKTGIDFAGPFHIKTNLRRNAPLEKAYACLFVCFTTKAVHVELVGNLTTQAFLNALQRFCDRRGLCTDIFSDNATNFVGANRRLQELKTLFQSSKHQQEVENSLSKVGIQWHFIPPRSPHFGGLWEAAVKSLKSHLYRTIGNASLTFEELNTVLIRVEAILNSRPLTPMSTHPSDISVLTPGHFLIGDSLQALPERDEASTPMNRLSRWRRVVQFTQQLWSRWTHDYLNQLQERKKWSTSVGPRLCTGTVVLIRDNNLPPLQWSVGRITETHVGKDNQIRVAKLKTSKGETTRAVRYLCPLPFEGNQPEGQ